MKKLSIIIIFLSIFVAAPLKASEVTQESEKKEMKGSSSEAFDNMGEMTNHHAVAEIAGVSKESEIEGVVLMAETSKGVFVNIVLSGVEIPGKHGIHIHENGSCDDSGKAAGGHFNPKGVDHGFLPKDEDQKAHLGDMGNIEVDEFGNAELSVFLPGISLTEGDNNVAGRAIILHQNKDDFGQPTGNAGGRIACGVIGLQSEVDAE